MTSFSLLSSMFSSAQNLRLSRTSISPGWTLLIFSIAWGPITSSTNLIFWEQYWASRFAWGSRDVKSSFPGLLWWDPSVTRASSSSDRVLEIALILVSSSMRCVEGSSGTLISTLRKTLFPLVSISSSVRKSYFFRRGSSQQP